MIKNSNKGKEFIPESPQEEQKEAEKNLPPSLRSFNFAEAMEKMEEEREQRKREREQKEREESKLKTPCPHCKGGLYPESQELPTPSSEFIIGGTSPSYEMGIIACENCKTMFFEEPTEFKNKGE